MNHTETHSTTQRKSINYLGYSQEELTSTITALNELLAAYHVYYQNLRNFHWNVCGENFFDLHQQFELLYNDARLVIDEIAERILTLRQRPISRFSDYLTFSKIKESPVLTEDIAMVHTILDNHRILIETLRIAITKANEANDEGTIDMLGGFLSSLEKKSWMLDAWANRRPKIISA